MIKKDEKQFFSGEFNNTVLYFYFVNTFIIKNLYIMTNANFYQDTIGDPTDHAHGCYYQGPLTLYIISIYEYLCHYLMHSQHPLNLMLSVTHFSLTHWPLGDLVAILKLQFSILFKLFYWLVSSDLLMIMQPYGCHGTSKDDKSTLVQVMAWCRQATSHYLSQCWPCSMSPYGVTRPQWVNLLLPSIISNVSSFVRDCLSGSI